jgi:hypothetical protein
MDHSAGQWRCVVTFFFALDAGHQCKRRNHGRAQALFVFGVGFIEKFTIDQPIDEVLGHLWLCQAQSVSGAPATGAHSLSGTAGTVSH